MVECPEVVGAKDIGAAWFSWEAPVFGWEAPVFWLGSIGKRQCLIVECPCLIVECPCLIVECPEVVGARKTSAPPGWMGSARGWLGIACVGSIGSDTTRGAGWGCGGRHRSHQNGSIGAAWFDWKAPRSWTALAEPALRHPGRMDCRECALGVSPKRCGATLSQLRWHVWWSKCPVFG